MDIDLALRWAALGYKVLPLQPGHVSATMFDGLRIALEKGSEVLHAAMAKLLYFHGWVTTPIFLRKRIIKRSHVAFHGRRIRDHDFVAY